LIAFLLVGLSSAAPVLVKPSPLLPVPNECARSTVLIKGEKPPIDLIVDGVVSCDAVAEPTSSLAYLLAMEKYADAADKIHQLEIKKANDEIEHYKNKLQSQNAIVPWYKTPKAQRWIGRFEIVALVGVVSWTSWNIQNTTGGRK
jgi:hypothetical protein|tara:strand:+ start:6857 stop:7291 length:435 start_codon:yes stop_codon:yes gene_type:complete